MKPGGTAMLVDSKYTGKIVDRGADWTRMGRWTYVTLNGRNGTRVTTVTGYRCGSVKIDQVGSSTSIAQQYGISWQRGNKNPNPYIDFLTDLKKWLKPKITDGEEILLLLDANEEWVTNAKIVHFAEELGLNNAEKAFHNELEPTRPKSNKTIDFMLGTDGVIENIKAFGRTPYNLETLGDHRGTFIDIDICNMLGYTKFDKSNNKQRKLKCNDTGAKGKYIKIVKGHFENHKIYERLEELVTDLKNNNKPSEWNIKQYNAIHTDIYRLCRNAEKGCTKGTRHDTKWSPTLRKAVHTKRYWRMRLDKEISVDMNDSVMRDMREKYEIEDGCTKEDDMKKNSNKHTIHYVKWWKSHKI